MVKRYTNILGRGDGWSYVQDPVTIGESNPFARVLLSTAAPNEPGSLSAAVARVIGTDYQPVEIPEDAHAGELLPRGFIAGTLGLGEAINTAIEVGGGFVGAERVEAFGRRGAEYWRETAEPFQPPKSIQGNVVENPRMLLDPDYWMYGIGNMAPSLLASLIPGLGAAAAVRKFAALSKVGNVAVRTIQAATKGKLGTKALSAEKLAAMLGGGLVAGPLEGSSTYKQSLGKGRTKKEARRDYVLMSVGSGILNALAVGEALFPGVKDAHRLIRYGVSALTEAVTEGLEEPLEALILDESMIEATKQAFTVAPIAFVMGGGAAVFGDVAQGKRRRDAAAANEAKREEFINTIRTLIAGGKLSPETAAGYMQSPIFKAMGVSEGRFGAMLNEFREEPAEEPPAPPAAVPEVDKEKVAAVEPEAVDVVAEPAPEVVTEPVAEEVVAEPEKEEPPKAEAVPAPAVEEVVEEVVEEEPAPEPAPEEQRYKVGKSRETYTVTEELPFEEGDLDDETFVEIRSDRDGGTQIVTKGELTPVKTAKKPEAVAEPEKITPTEPKAEAAIPEDLKEPIGKYTANKDKIDAWYAWGEAQEDGSDAKNAWEEADVAGDEAADELDITYAKDNYDPIVKSAGYDSFKRDNPELFSEFESQYVPSKKPVAVKPKKEPEAVAVPPAKVEETWEKGFSKQYDRQSFNEAIGLHLDKDILDREWANFRKFSESKHDEGFPVSEHFEAWTAENMGRIEEIPVKSVEEEVPGLEEAVEDKKIPLLIGAQRSNDIIQVEFTNERRIPTVEELNDLLGDRKASVVKLKGVLTDIRNATRFRIDFFSDQGKKASEIAQEALDTVFGGENVTGAELRQKALQVIQTEPEATTLKKPAIEKEKAAEEEAEREEAVLGEERKFAEVVPISLKQTLGDATPEEYVSIIEKMVADVKPDTFDNVRALLENLIDEIPKANAKVKALLEADIPEHVKEGALKARTEAKAHLDSVQHVLDAAQKGIKDLAALAPAKKPKLKVVKKVTEADEFTKGMIGLKEAIKAKKEQPRQATAYLKTLNEEEKTRFLLKKPAEEQKRLISEWIALQKKEPVAKEPAVEEEVVEEPEEPETKLSAGKLISTVVRPEYIAELSEDVIGWMSGVLPPEAMKKVKLEIKKNIGTKGRNITQTAKDYGGVIPENGKGAATVGRLEALIEISYQQGERSMERTSYHEAFHVVAKWLLPSETYLNLMAEFDGNEENMAEAFAGYSMDRKYSLAGKKSLVRKIFDQFVKLFNKIKSKLAVKGYETSADVFENVWRGEYKDKRRTYKIPSEPPTQFSVKGEPTIEEMIAGMKVPVTKTAKVSTGKTLFKQDAMPESDLDELEAAYETYKDLWFSEKDEYELRSSVELRKLQKELLAALGETRTNSRVRDIDTAIQIYLDTKRDPSHIKAFYDSLNEHQQRIVELSRNLTPAVKAVAEKIRKSYDSLGVEAKSFEVITNVISNYTGRVWDFKEGKRRATESGRKYGITTKHARKRKLMTILEGWSEGLELKVHGATTSLKVVKDEVQRTIADKQFMTAMKKVKDIDGNPLLTANPPSEAEYVEIVHPAFVSYVPGPYVKGGKIKDTYINKKTGEEVKIGRNIYITKTYALVLKGQKRAAKIYASRQDAELDRQKKDNPDLYVIQERSQVFERQKLYAPKEQAKNLNNILGVSRLKGLKGIDTVTKYNAIMKAWILQSSLFHHLAFMRSYYLGTNKKLWSKGEMNIIKAYKSGLEMIDDLHPDVVRGVRGGLTMGLRQDWEESLLEEKTIFGEWFDKTTASRVVKDKILELRKRQSDFLFGEFGAGLKAKSFIIEYRHAVAQAVKKKGGELNETELDSIAKEIASLINDDFGGLHLGRLGRNPTRQHIFRLFALAPDWTESNVRTMVKIFTNEKGSARERRLYQRFWAGIIIKGAAVSVMLNFLMAGGDLDEFEENYKRAWEEGNLKFALVDITPVYKFFGGDTERRKYFPIFGHFTDPFKFITHPIRSAHHKGSVVYGIAHEALVGADYAGRKFTTAIELFETRKTVKWGPGRPVEYSQLPSYLLSQLTGTQPVQIQYMLAWLMGEMEGFDALSNSMGLSIKTTFGGATPKKKTKEIKKGRFGGSGISRATTGTGRFSRPTLRQARQEAGK